ncbi:hypothetical protein A3H10_04740 [Candidatus Uhrbacteria bacterium RIFCSPLOWO2_12_FULL_46_10]|uniref:Bacterial bifunctional deaminase-reductase C-terminal domain-containing protein n=1 Tax=Candidatus Uhrbacteria bacterium RIFCSPLOWO2_01_FULL_47_25 TaxID=1802402 RepID=A0A1F7UW21_9BACT|nr:MAG: hypothetical protein A3D60_05035 [Candidatus Uhrbacteria bacterium RIFCSPHIGHO2_02_FULL_47_29]OGL75541.1 MAG: hypothetical protein A3E96_01565 [Candidatus Uhrbacteria bacterium RIFCSPHIGHO2_12_FULL_46_13]OGL82456.1 MAG: hypothetical protein A2936_02005 [Candidatus Uhrbacteria bacterium RIFCSPLOWO2_01_FULL_47_25]OGL90906.1 MAG: hypothetical protein A3H10_04740 [Candidatus Uhrbacteria bacterium RIFCSPLOWO2_12_FULL_46_10]
MNTSPIIIAVAAVTIDGKIALHAGHSTDWTSSEDKDFLHGLLDKSDVIVVGNNTYKVAQKPLAKRNCVVFTHSVRTTARQHDNLLFCNPSGVDIRTILSPYKTVAVLGGTQTYTYFLENDLLNELYLTIEPLVFGRGLNIFESMTAKEVKFHLFSVKKLNRKGSILLYYRIV